MSRFSRTPLGGRRSPGPRRHAYGFSFKKQGPTVMGMKPELGQYIHNFMRLWPFASCTLGRNVLMKMAKIVATGTTMGCTALRRNAAWMQTSKGIRMAPERHGGAK
jgi:hypothetical protein